MEQEAVHRALNQIQGKVKVLEITTDSSTAVTKMLGMFDDLWSITSLFITADKYSGIKHSMDVWHKAKLLKKVLSNVSLCNFCIPMVM